VVQDLVHLLGELLVDRRLEGVDRGEDIVADDLGVLQRLLRQSLDRLLDPRRLGVGVRLEFLLQQGREIVGCDGFQRGGVGFCSVSWAITVSQQA